VSLFKIRFEIYQLSSIGSFGKKYVAGISWPLHYIISVHCSLMACVVLCLLWD